MNLNDLAIYIKIYEALSLNKAAKELNYAQSNLTNRLKHLEQEFDTYFFIRTAKGLTPTEKGTEFYTYALSVLNQTTELKKSFETQKQKARILTTELLFDYLIIFQEAYIINSYEIDIVKSSQIEEQLTKRAYNLVFSYEDKYLSFQAAEQSLNAYLIANQAVSKKEEKLTVFVNSDKDCPFRAKTFKIFKNYSVDSFEIIELDSMNSILRLIENKAGIALLPAYFAESTEKNLCFWDETPYPITFYIHQAKE